MSNPPVYVTSPALPPFDEFITEIRSIWDSGILTNQGPKYRALEYQLRSYLDVDYAPLFSSGHLALEVAIKALDLGGGEVITTPYTFASTTLAIVNCGLTPVFCDINPSDYTLDESKLDLLLTPRTKAIIPVHVYGIPCHIEEIQAFADRHGLYVIYDAAHAFGETYNGRSIASYGDVSMFSLHATKVYNAVEGGLLAFNSDNHFYEKVCALRQFGEISHSPDSAYLGTNAKLSELHAAMGICNLRHIGEYVGKRRAIFSVYQDAFSGNANVKTIQYPRNLTPNYAYYPILISKDSPNDRDEVASILERSNVYARKYFYPITSSFSAFHGLFPVDSTPIARDISNRVLCLPLHPKMDIDDAERIAWIVLKCTS